MNKFLGRLAQILYDKKGSNILALDVQGISSITDQVLIAEGNVDRHVIALGNAIISEMKQEGESPVYVEGMQNGDWVVIDYMDLMIHIFMPGLREKYGLERLFSKGKIIDLKIQTEKQ